MNVLLLLTGCLAAFVLAYRLYAGWISRVLRSTDSLPTPAHSARDDRDYVPTRTPVLFSHHYATIAGAGPIVGPTIACVYGLWPALLWVVLGSIFIGAVHDYSSLFISLRERGRTIAEITGNLTGRAGFLLYISFTLVLIVIVTAAFLDLSALTLGSQVPAALLQLPADNPFGWQLSQLDGVQKVRVGGIATTSVIIITLLSPLLGLLLRRPRLDNRLLGGLALLIACGSIWAGMHFPLGFGSISDAQLRLLWMAILSVYVLLASALPVWLVLQPRDFINSFTLYGGMALLFAGAVSGGLRGLQTDPAMAWTLADGNARFGFVFPLLFITVACGAISGFHSLVCSGTSSKQCDRESDARRVGFGAMLTEGLLAVLVIIAIAAGLGHEQLLALQFPAGGGGNPVVSFALGCGLFLGNTLGIPVHVGTVFGLLMVEGFLVTTLDSAVRLNRYLFEELWFFLRAGDMTPLLSNGFFNSGLSVLAMLAVALPNGWKIIWPVFGTANQLMAALTLAGVSIWLAIRARPVWFTLLPAIFMMLTCMVSLANLLRGSLPAVLHGSADVSTLSIALLSMLLLLLGIGVVWLAGSRLWEIRSGRIQPIFEDPADKYLSGQPAGQEA
ncbi:MAG: carbon starvation CstA family protein [bacterium]